MLFRHSLKNYCFAFLPLLAAPCVAEAAVVTPVSAFASSYYGAPQHPANLVNNSGMNFGSGDVQSFIHATDGGAAGMWHAGAGQGIGGAAPVVANQYLVFDLGDNYNLTQAYLWQMVQPPALYTRGIKDFSLWASPNAPNPADVANPPAVYDLTGFTEILVPSVLAIGSGPAITQTFALSGATNVRQIYLDISSAHSGAANDYVGLAEIKFDGVLPGLVVDRDTGNISLTNNTPSPLTFIAYEILSETVGALDASGWTSIAQNYDAGNPGPNQVSSSNWIEFTPAPRIGSVLGEGAQPGDSATLGAGQSIDLGDSWIRNPFGDINLRLMKSDGTLYTTGVEYTGAEVVLGDFSGNGTVGPEDWPLFRAGFGSSGGGKTLAQMYQLGDLNADGQVDLVDFRTFEAIYDDFNGAGAFQGMIAGSSVPEPGSIALLACGLSAVLLAKRRAIRKRIIRVAWMPAIAMLLSCVSGREASAQVFTFTTPEVPAATALTAFPGFGVERLFNDITLTAADIGVKQYTAATTVDYAGVGVGPAGVFLDFGQSVSANYLAYAHRVGGDPLADKAGQINVWFSDTNFGGAIPLTTPNATISPKLELDGTATLLPYSLGDVFSGQYVALEIILSQVSAQQPTNNLGGGELRVLMGPSDVVLEIDRGSGSMTIRNQGSAAQAIEINGYEITSADGSLLSSWSGFENGSVAGFAPGNGTGNGWEKGDSSDANRLTEAYLLGSSTIGIGNVLPLGTGYDATKDAQDVEFWFSITNGNGLLFPGVVKYVGESDVLFGDYNDDGQVNAADYVVWRDRLGAASLLNENPNESPGIVDEADYAVWRANFGSPATGTASGSHAVPEPSSLALGCLLLGGLLCLGQRKTVFSRAVKSSFALLLLAAIAPTLQAATPDAVYLFGDNSSQVENGAPGAEVGQGIGAEVPGFTIDHFGDSTFAVLSTFRDLTPGPNTLGQRPVYVDTAALQFPGTSLGSTTTGVGIQFDGIDDHLRGPGLGYPQQGDDAFTGNFANAYQGITTRIIDGWVRPTNLNNARQDIVNDTYQFGIHITADNTWGMNFGSTSGAVNTFLFDSGVDVAGTLDENGWAHVQHRTFGSAAGGLYVNGELLVLTAAGAPFYHPAAAGATGANREIVFGANLPGTGNFFFGQLDNFQLLIAGDNRTLSVNGQNYGTVDLSVDNGFIAANVVRGDANGDGFVNGDGTGLEEFDDVTFFVNHYFNRQFVTDVNGNQVLTGDITSVTTMADFNGDGRTDIFDWYILVQEHENSALAASLDLGALLAGGSSVPEPSTWVIALSALISLAVARRMRCSLVL